MLDEHRVLYTEIYVDRNNPLPPGANGTVPFVTVGGQKLGGLFETASWLRRTPSERTAPKPESDVYDGSIWDDGEDENDEEDGLLLM